MKKIITAGLLLTSLFLVGCSITTNNGDTDPVTAGEKCNKAEGFTYSTEIKACVKEFNLNANQTKAATMAVETYGTEDGLTITEVKTVRCPSCFDVTLQNEDGDSSVVKIDEWAVSEIIKDAETEVIEIETEIVEEEPSS